MKKIIILLIILIIVIGGGYLVYRYAIQPTLMLEGEIGEEIAGPEIPSGSEWRDKIETKKDNDFSVVLETNPTTGYDWKVEIDEDYLQLVDMRYRTFSEKSMVGAGGEETFKFFALKPGTTKIIFSYLRSWEDKPPLEVRVCEVVIE